MKYQFASALAIGACIIFGCGVIAMAFGTVSGLIGACMAFAFGRWLLKWATELSNKE